MPVIGYCFLYVVRWDCFEMLVTNPISQQSPQVGTDNRLLSLLGVESCVAFRIEHYCSRMLVAGTRLCIVVEIARQTLRGKIRVVYLGISVSTESTRVPVSMHPRQPHTISCIFVTNCWYNGERNKTMIICK